MSRRDGTGPMGMGARTGRGMGLCSTDKAQGAIVSYGQRLGLGCRRGFGRNAFNNTINPKTQKDLLLEEKAILENRLNLINNELSNLKDELSNLKDDK